MKPINSHGISRRWLGVGMSLVAAVAAQASTDVTFTIDMSGYNGGTPPAGVTLSGSLNGWNTTANPLINVTGTIWSNTVTVSDAPGAVESCKFVADGNYESIANRQFILGTGTQVLPQTSWNLNSTWPPAPTNYITFQCDMSAQVALGNFTNQTPGNVLLVAGAAFPVQWGAGNYTLTNNPSLPGQLANIYTGTFEQIGFPPAGIEYKFRMNGGWESIANRTASVTNNQVLPLVYYNDNTVSDLVITPTAVKFSVYLTNGTTLINGGTFTKGTDNIAINGDWLGWWGWGVNAAPPEYVMTESEIPDVYTNTLIIPKGTSLALTYKYGVDGLDNENGQQTNHVRYIRNYGPSYTFPQDIWSFLVIPPAPYPNPGITSTNIVEPSFGYLTIKTPNVDNNFVINWLGRPAVLLQSRSSLTSGIWTDVIGTDAAQSAIIPNTGANQFFRLKKNP